MMTAQPSQHKRLIRKLLYNNASGTHVFLYMNSAGPLFKKSAKNMGALDIVASAGGQLLGNAIGSITGQNSMSDQVAAAKQMAIFNREQQMQLWRDTNFKAQADQMRKAGLNVGLMYGKGGGQGGSVAANTGQMPSGYSGNNENVMGMAIAAEQARAQTKVAEAQARALNADAAVKETYGSAQAEATIANLNANTGNAEADTMLKNVKTELEKINKDIAEGSKEYSIFSIIANAEKLQGEARIAWVKANVDRATQETQIKAIEQNYVGLILQNEATKAGIKLTEEQVKKASEEIITMRGNLEVNKNTQQQNKEYQEALIKLGIGKIAVDAALGIGELFRRVPRMPQNKTTWTEDSKGNWSEKREMFGN